MSSWTDIVSAVAAGGGTGTAVIALFHRLAKHALVTVAKDIADNANKPLKDDIDVVKQDITSIRLSLATQFGGNGGGMREAINSLQVDMAEVKGRMAVHPRPYPTGGANGPG